MKNILSILLLFLLVACSSSTSHKNQIWSMEDKDFIEATLNYYDISNRYWSKSNKPSKAEIKKSANLLYPFAKSGNPAAQYLYADSLVWSNQGQGYGSWLLKSSSNNYLPANRKLATIYIIGQYLKKDLNKSIKLIQENAKYGHAQDIAVLAANYRTGKLIKKDIEKYYSLTTHAAMHGNPSSQSSLAQAYSRGVGGKKELIKAYAWYEITLKNSIYRSLSGNLNTLKTNMTKDQIEKAISLKYQIENEMNDIAKTLVINSKNGDLRSQRILAHRAFSGDIIIKKDYILAAKWLSISSKNPKNDQKDFDNFTLQIALSRLNESEKNQVRLNIKTEYRDDRT